MPRTRTATEERELLPLHRPSLSLSTTGIGSPASFFSSPPTSPKFYQPPHPQRSTTFPPPKRPNLGDALVELPNGTPVDGVHVPGSSSRARLSQPIYDPYTGQYKGRLVPASSSGSSSSSSSLSDAEPILADHRLRQQQRAAALDKIRILQSEVARTHLALEGIGGENLLNNDEVHNGSQTSLGQGSGRRSDWSSSGARDEWSERRKGIDAVVSKLDNLSAAIKAFHSIPDTTFNFPPHDPPQPPKRSGTLLSPTSRTQSPDQRGLSPFGYTSTASPHGAGFRGPSTPSRAGLRPILDQPESATWAGGLDSPTSTQASLRLYR